MARAENVIPLKVWKDWSAGIGFLKDDGVTPGMSYASGLLGLLGELRPAPFFNTATTGLFTASGSFELSGSIAYKLTTITIAPASGETVAALGSPADSKVNGTTLTYSLTIPTGDDVVLYVTVHNDSNADPTSVTFDGNGLTKVQGVTTTTERSSIWRKVAPGAATADVVVTLASGTDIISSAQAFSGVHQSTSETATNASNATSDGPLGISLDAEVNGAILQALSWDITAEVVAQDGAQTLILNDTQGTMDAMATYKLVATSDHSFQYFHEAVANNDPGHAFLYANRGKRLITGQTVNKIDLSNADFGTVETGTHVLSGMQPGQAAKYQGFWWFPTGNDQKGRNISVVGTGNVSTDTLGGAATPFTAGSDHYTLLGDQIVGVVKQGIAGVPGLGGIGAQDGGVRILKVDGAPATVGDWGSPFPAGEITERVAGLITLSGATFVLSRDGLYSFNNRGRSGEVFTDLRQWQNPHVNIPMSIWRGGLCIPHPSGFLYYIPGDVSIPFGVEAKKDVWIIPPDGVPEIHSGLYHDSSVVGDFLYAIYQPDLSSTAGLLMVAYGTPPDDVSWQVLGSITINDPNYMSGIHVATSSRPISADRVTPTVWFNNGADLGYVILNPKAGPFRARADIHRVNISGDAYMSELVFPEPVDLAELVVYTQDMLTDDTDEWQMSFIVNATGNEENFAPIVQNGRNVISLTNKLVHRLTLRVQWIATSTSNRVPPTIAKIELFGKPTESVVS